MVATSAITNVNVVPEAGWTDLSPYVSFPFTLTELRISGGDSGNGCILTAIEIDGVVLDNTGDRAGGTSVNSNISMCLTLSIFVVTVVS